MTKVYTKTPQEEFRIVRASETADHYEVWVIKPVCVGTLDRLGNANVVSDDKRRFVNIFHAAQHLLERAKETALASSMRLNDDRPEMRNVVMTGWELLNKDKLQQLRKLRGIDGPMGDADLKRNYAVTPDEMTALGLTR